MTWRGRDIRWVVPRRADGTIAGRGGAAAAAARRRGAAGAAAAGAGRRRGGGGRGGGLGGALRAGRLEDVLLADPAADPGAGDRLSGTACSAASLRTSGVTYGESPDGSGVGSG